MVLMPENPPGDVGSWQLLVRYPRCVRGLQAKLHSQNKLLIDAITLLLPIADPLHGAYDVTRQLK